MKMARFAGTAIIKNYKILLVQESHKEAYGLWSLPLGHVDEGESENEAAIRETKEETGYNVILDKSKTFEIRGKDFKSTNNFDDYIILLTIFEASIIDGALKTGSDILNARWFDIEKVKELPLRGEWVKKFK